MIFLGFPSPPSRRRRLSWRLWLAAVLMAAAETGHAFVSQYTPAQFPMRWNFDFYDFEAFPAQDPTTLSIVFHLSTETSSATTRPQEWDAVRAAFAQWQLVPGTKIQFKEAAAIPAPADVSLEDQKNTVVWFAGNRFVCGGSAFLSSNAAALTCLASLDDGTLVEADMILNKSAQSFTDYDNPKSNAMFVESVVLHEIGHLLGFNHSPVGAATMFWFTRQGLSAQIGLSSDEILGARAVYGTAATKAATGTIRGSVRMNGAPVFGAVVVVEDPQGILTSGTVSSADGSYVIPALPPGTHHLRVTPLDPNGNLDQYLVRGFDLDEYRRTFNNAATAFLPLTNAPVTLLAGGDVSVPIQVLPGNPAFRITETRPSYNPVDRTSGDAVLQLRRGQTGATLGVYTPGLLGTSANLRVSGSGISYGPTTVTPNALRGMPLIEVEVTVETNAVPGMRSLIVDSGGKAAWANGFVEILPDFPDDDRNGLDDAFQRRWFSPWIRPEADRLADPDGDGWINEREAASGSNPTDAASVHFRVLSAKVTADGTQVTAETAPGRKFQLWGRSAEVGSTQWQPVGTPVTASAATQVFNDPASTERIRFYRVQQVP